MAVDLETIAKAFASLRACGVRPPSRKDADMLESMEMYQMLLSDLTDEQVLQAVTVYLRKKDSYYWPTPGQLRSCIQQPVSTRYEQAWAACMDAASKRLGTPAHPGCSREPVRRYINDEEWVDFPAPEYKWEVDEATWRGIQACGGWQVFKKMDLSHIASQRVAFRGAYEGAVETIHRQLEHKTAAALIGVRPMLKMVD
tara:strand:- start:610 stop:1206 length:597 start_codon:yes stop_codon:yes gene_type:complete